MLSRQDEGDQRRHPHQIVHQDLDDGDLEVRRAGNPDFVVALFLVDDGDDFVVDAATDEFTIVDIPEINDQRGGVTAFRNQTAAVDRIVEHPLPERLDGLGSLSHIVDEGRDVQSALDAAYVHRVAQRDHVIDTLYGLYARGHSLDALQGVTRKDIRRCQRNDQYLVAAEGASGMVIELLGGVVLGQQPVGGRIDLQAEMTRMQVDQPGDGQDGKRCGEQQDQAGGPREEVGDFRE
jgi:hypothetical protein